MKKEEISEASNLLEKRRRESLAAGVMETSEAMLRRLSRMEEKLGALTGEKKSPAEEKDELFEKLKVQEAREKRLLEENRVLKDERDQALKDQEGLRKSLNEEAEETERLREACGKLQDDLKAANEDKKKLRNENKKRCQTMREEHNAERENLEKHKRVLKRQVESLTGQKRNLEGKKRQLEEKLQNLRVEKEALGEELAEKERLLLAKTLSPAASEMDELSFSELASRISTACGLQMVQCLQLIKALAGDKVVILPKAFESARDVPRFSQKERMISLLSKLIFSYTEKYFEGGDNLAREVFTTKEYSAQDSQTTQNTGKASVRQPRTVVYEGERIDMTQHLKIGVADNKHQCLRVYFFMERARRRPVIGYLGPHPDI